MALQIIALACSSLSAFTRMAAKSFTSKRYSRIGLTSSCATIGGLYGCGEILRRHGLDMRILKEERRMRRQGNLRKILGVQRCARAVNPTGNGSVGKLQAGGVGGVDLVGSTRKDG